MKDPQPTMDVLQMIDDFAEFDADCAVRLRVFDDWAKRAAHGADRAGRRAFEEFLAVHPLMEERSGAHEPGNTSR